MNKLKIAIMGEMPATGYSGGRYHAWVMAEALAQQENTVYMITNNIPEFARDFECYKNHNKIKVELVDTFYSISIEEKRLDYVICVPAIGKKAAFYYACLDFSIRMGARFAFINFESPNWFSKCTDIQRPEADYKALKKICRYGCLIFSSAQESKKYAVEYYNKFPNTTQHCVWSPPINSLLADRVNEKKTNQIIIFLRVRDKHKGGNDFLQLLGEYLRGMTCVCVVGTGEIANDFLEEAKSKAEGYGITLRFENSLSDYRKFEELKKSKLLLFPSHFEGYGYPPVEALYCGARCIAYDLPVLREISGSALTYCKMGNVVEMSRMAEGILKGECDVPICVDTADFIKQSERIQDILEINLQNDKLKGKDTWINRIGVIARRWYGLSTKIITNKKGVPKIIKYCIDNEIVISHVLDDKAEKWKYIRSQIEGKEVYIWGCGKAYRELYPRYKNRIKIKGILDKSPEKIGTKDNVSRKYVIQKPEILKDKNKEQIVVIIANKIGVDEIIGELSGMGIRYYHSLCMIEINSLPGRMYQFLFKNITNLKRRGTIK